MNKSKSSLNGGTNLCVWYLGKSWVKAVSPEVQVEVCSSIKNK